MRSLLSHPDPAEVTTRALAQAAETAHEDPNGVLCLSQSRERVETLTRRWREEYDQLRFEAATLDGYVSDCYERATGNLATSTLSGADRFRLVEAAVEQHGVAHDSGAFADITNPSNDLIDQVQGLFSLLEYAGYNDPDALERALLAAGSDGDDALDVDALYGSFRDTTPPFEESTLREQADVFSDLYERYHTLRATHHPEWQHSVAEHYLALLDDERLIEAVPDSVDVVILDGLTRLAPAEREAVARFSRAYPTIATLPLTHDSLAGAGVDTGVERALGLYDALGFSLENHRTDGVNQARLETVQALYDHGTTEETHTVDAVDLDFASPATEREEVRNTARRVRALLADDVDPAEIGIVVTDRATYRGILAEVLGAYDIPFTFVNEIGIEQTLVGDAIQALLDLTEPERQVQALSRLNDNALVSISALGIDPDALTQARATIEDETVSALGEWLKDHDHEPTARGIDQVLTRLEPDSRSLEEFVGELRALTEECGISDAVEDYATHQEATGSHRPAYERSAYRAVERVLDSFEALSGELANDAPAERIRQGLLAELIGGPRQQADYVRVYPIAEAELASFEQLFVLGLTMENFPSESDTMAFFEAVNEADEEFGREHTGRRARYILGTLLTGSDSVTLSTPRHTVDGTTHVPAPMLSELKHHIEFPDDYDATPEAPPIVESEDLQESYASWARGEHFETPERATEPLAGAELSATARTFAEQGVTCSWRRSRPGLTEHEAQLGTVIDDVYPSWRREPYSPSALEDYARCPFVYLMKQVLGFEEDYGEEDDISRADRGTYVHEVLADFYRQLRDNPREAVEFTAFDRSTLEATLLDIALTRLDELGELETPFARRTLGRMLAGLGEPAANPYHDFGATEADGLFVRFLDRELEERPTVETHPTYFEGSMGLDFDDVELISDDAVPIETPQGTVPIHGIADRIDVSADSPRRFHVRDYKTGNTPSRTEVLEGTKLQLPLYGAALESALQELTGDPHVAISGSYYQLKAPDEVHPLAGQITSKEAIESDDEADGKPTVDGPSQSWRLPFDTDREFQRFIRTVTPTRVGRIANGVEKGAFHPTLLSESQAGCEDCSFRQACDVRHHHRQDTIETLDPTEQYVAERARETDFDLGAYTDGGEN